MRTEADPLFSKYDRRESCVLETRFSVVGLYVVVEAQARETAQSVHVEVFFPQHRGFLLLDESDMPSWLAAQCFRTDHLVYRVSQGGWLGNLNPDDSLLQIASAQSNEWIIVTANECVSVFSAFEPRIQELSV
ncbi:hypothetical protein [Niveibacterium umoris]